MDGQLVVFTLSGEHYGVEISKVQEIIRMQRITQVPGSPDFVMGVLNLRGKVVPVIDLRRRLGLPGSVDAASGRIMVVVFDGRTIGMAVDAVTEVLRFTEDMVEKPSDLVSTPETRYLKGIIRLDGRLVIFADLDSILSQPEKDEVLSVAQVA